MRPSRAAAYTALSQRKIISGFLTDSELGRERLMSMPDRVTNAIETAGGQVAYRPTVVSGYSGEMSTVAAWWDQWKEGRETHTHTSEGT